MRLINPLYLVNNTSGVIKNYNRLCVNSTSLDITASNIVYAEDTSGVANIIDVKQKQPLHLQQSECMQNQGFELIFPHASIIVETKEEFDIPNDVCAMYQSVGNLNVSNIASLSNIWVKPNWDGKLRITLHNYNKYHTYKLYQDQVIGQLVFFNINDTDKYQFEWN